MPNPGDRFISFNDAGLTDAEILTRFNTLYGEGYTGPIASKLQDNGSTTYYIGGYTA